MSIDNRTILVNFRIDEETRKALRIWCVENNISMADHLRRMVDDTLEGKIYASPANQKRKAHKKESELDDFLSQWQ